MNKLILGVFHLRHFGMLGLSTAWLHNFSYHPKAECKNCFIIHPKYLHLHQKILTGLGLSQVPVFMTDLVLGSSGGYSQTCLKRSLIKLLEIISLKHRKTVLYYLGFESGRGHFFLGSRQVIESDQLTIP